MDNLTENNKKALCIDDSTLFLLGNGCSMEYGFPQGNNLLLEGFNIVQEYSYDINNYQWGRAHRIYQQLESFLTILSDLHKKVLSGNLESFHYPEYLSYLITAHSPNLCSFRKNVYTAAMIKHCQNSDLIFQKKNMKTVKK